MIKLILVRHGITICNEGGAMSGLTDSMLSEKGIVQADKLTNYLKDKKIDKIYTTPFARTKDTVKKLSESNLIQVEETSKLNEINFGDFEGLSFDVIKDRYPEEVEKMINEGFKYKYPDGESLEETFFRVRDEIRKIIHENENSTVLICSHGGTIRNIISYLLCDDYKYHWNFRIDNGSITEIEIDNDFPVINKINDTTYLNI